MVAGRRRPSSRITRREAHAVAAFKRFVSSVMRSTGLDEEEATRACVSVLGVLEQRLSAAEAAHLNAQLPSRLRALLIGSRGDAAIPPLRLHRDELLQRIARDLNVTVEQAQSLAGAVFRSVAQQISKGEFSHVLGQLPADRVAMFPSPAR